MIAHYREVIKYAFANLRSSPVRTLLAMIGIVAGTASIVGLNNVTVNAGVEAARHFAAMGTDTLQIRHINSDNARLSHLVIHKWSFAKFA